MSACNPTDDHRVVTVVVVVAVAAATAAATAVAADATAGALLINSNRQQQLCGLILIRKVVFPGRGNVFQVYYGRGGNCCWCCHCCYCCCWGVGWLSASYTQ